MISEWCEKIRIKNEQKSRPKQRVKPRHLSHWHTGGDCGSDWKNKRRKKNEQKINLKKHTVSKAQPTASVGPLELGIVEVVGFKYHWIMDCGGGWEKEQKTNEK